VSSTAEDDDDDEDELDDFSDLLDSESDDEDDDSEPESDSFLPFFTWDLAGRPGFRLPVIFARGPVLWKMSTTNPCYLLQQCVLCAGFLTRGAADTLT
jgi:hypothetical protein